MIRICCLALLTCLVLVPLARAEEGEFRCETDVFVADAKDPAAQTITIFTGQRAYDFLLTKPEEITVYDFARNEFKLLDTGRKMRVTIAGDDLLQFTAAFKTFKPESDLFAFCLAPSFKETFADNVLLLDAKQVKYRATITKPTLEGADRRYREFADWSARLNAIRPGNLPPFPRIELNKALVAHGGLPEEVERTVIAGRLGGAQRLKSRQLFNWALSDKDRRDIDRVGGYLSSYTAVSIEDYFEFDKAKKTASR